MLALLVAGHASFLLSPARPSAASRRSSSIVAAEATCDVICVGAGVPKRGMGWYHAKQMLDGDTPSASLSAVVEPWFLGPGADSPPGATFAAWAAETGPKGVAFCKSVADVPKPDGPRMALISGRTADNPRLLREVIEAGCTAVYLEKPGAPTVEELGRMKDDCAAKGATIWMVRAAAWQWTLTRSPRWRLHETASVPRRASIRTSRPTSRKGAKLSRKFREGTLH